MTALKPLNHGAKWSEDDKEKVFELYKKGWSYQKIASSFKRTSISIELQIREHFIKSMLKKREIKTLYHFTDLRNLESIKKFGLLSISKLNEKNIEYHPNDPQRLDGIQNGICLSISGINKHLLKVYKQRYPEKKWVIIYIDASVLIKSGCLYFSSNAAKRFFNKAKDSWDLGSVRAFEAMFDEQIPSSPNATRQGKDKWEPTCDQAEVVFVRSISKKHIIKWENI